MIVSCTLGNACEKINCFRVAYQTAQSKRCCLQRLSLVWFFQKIFRLAVSGYLQQFLSNIFFYRKLKTNTSANESNSFAHTEQRGKGAKIPFTYT